MWLATHSWVGKSGFTAMSRGVDRPSADEAISVSATFEKSWVPEPSAGTHRLSQGPPQSTPSSLPFWMPSVQLCTLQALANATDGDFVRVDG